MKAPSRKAFEAYYRKKGLLLYVEADYTDIYAAYIPGWAVVYHHVTDLVYADGREEKYHHFGSTCQRRQVLEALESRMSNYVSALRGSGNSYKDLQEPHLLPKVKEAYVTAELLELVNPRVGVDGIKEVECRYGQAGKLEYGDWCLTNHSTRRQHSSSTARGIKH